MADLPSIIQKINDIEVSAEAPHSESLMAKLGGTINGLIDRGLQIDDFTSNGTWTVPQGVTTALVIGCGGGGGGSAGRWNGGGYGGGGCGAPLGIRVLTGLTPGQTHVVTIGSGGAGGNPNMGSGVDGHPGGNTTLGSLVTFYGAPGGRIDGSSSARLVGFTRGGAGTSGGANSTGGVGEGNAMFSGGNGGFGRGGGGGAGPFGNGADGGTVNGPGQHAAPGTGAGGGGGGTAQNAYEFGGNGGSGRLMILWFGKRN